MEEQACDNNMQRGYVAIMSVLVLGAIGSMLVFSLLQWGIVDTKVALAISDAQIAYATAHGCAEELLQQVRDTGAATASGTMTVGAGSCAYSMTSPTAITRKILATGTFGGAVNRVEVLTGSLSPQITIVSWLELATFY